MLIPLEQIKPSPFNPKAPFTRKQLAALKKGIKTYGFKRSLCVCKDFESGEGFYALDGNTAIELLAEAGIKEIDCHIVEKVTDEKSLKRFMAAYSINKKPLYGEFASALGKIDFSEFTGLDFGKFSFDINIDKVFEKTRGTPAAPEETSTTAEETAIRVNAANNLEPKETAGRQSQYFLTLPPDCVDKLRNFVKTKAYKENKTEAIAQKIDAMNDKQFLENILQIVL